MILLNIVIVNGNVCPPSEARAHRLDSIFTNFNGLTKKNYCRSYTSTGIIYIPYSINSFEINNVKTVIIRKKPI